MRKLVLILVLMLSVALPSQSAFWNKNKNQNTQAQSQQQQQQTQVQTQNTNSSQDANQASYPQDVDGAPIAEDEYIDHTDVEEMYRIMPVPDFKYIHNIDPGEYQDTMYTTWSPYPLFRLTAPLFFISFIIEQESY